MARQEARVTGRSEAGMTSAVVYEQQQVLAALPSLCFPEGQGLGDIFGPVGAVGEYQEAEPERSLSFDQTFFSPDELFPAQHYSPPSTHFGGLQRDYLDEPYLQAESSGTFCSAPTAYCATSEQDQKLLKSLSQAFAVGGGAHSSHGRSGRAEPWLPDADIESEPHYAVQWPSPANRPATKLVSPFSATVVQANQLLPSAAWNQSHALSQAAFEASSRAEAGLLSQPMENRVSSTKPVMTITSGPLLGRELSQPFGHRAHSMTFGQRYSDVASAERSYMMRRTHTKAPLRADTCRAASSPACGIDVGTTETMRPAKRSRGPIKAIVRRTGCIPALERPLGGSSPLGRAPLSANSVRIVSGRGEFDCPAWRPHDQKPQQKTHCLTIRSNELGKPSKADSDTDLGDMRASASRNNSDGLSNPYKRSLSGETTLATAEPRRATRASGKAAAGAAYGQERECTNSPGMDALAWA